MVIAMVEILMITILPIHVSISCYHVSFSTVHNYGLKGTDNMM